jgi:hypothetical protein
MSQSNHPLKARRPHGPGRGGQRGQSMTELALVAPLLFLMAIGVADVGRAYHYREAVANASRQAARLMAQDQDAQKFACKKWPATLQGTLVTRDFPDLVTVPEDMVSKVINAAALEASRDGTTAGSVLNQPSAVTRVTFTFHCKPSVPDPVPYTNKTAGSVEPESLTSDAVRVELDYTFKVLTPLVGNLFGDQVIHIRASNYQRNEF